jgi:two-component system, NarL family, invasion response regulator UvrY
MDQESSGDPSIRVLIVDDHVLFAEALSTLLQRNDRIEVVGAANSGPDAIDQALMKNADVVVMDVGMPGVDGLETTRRLRTIKPDTRVIVLTGLSDSDLEQRAADAGASALLTKGAADREVVDTIVAVYDGRLNL